MLWGRIVFFGLLCSLIPASLSQSQESLCYDDNKQPQRCMPPFENLVFGKTVSATSTCGLARPQEYCPVMGGGSCETCDSDNEGTSHGHEFLTDMQGRDTWWQSETLLEGIQYPNSVNLTLDLGGECEITYIQIRFQSPRPESMAVYKNIRGSSSNLWQAYEYFSGSCEDTFGIEPDQAIPREDQTQAVCTREYSDISPLSGGQVTFSPLMGRPDAFRFDQSPELQDWVTATDLKITLNRVNTFGDEASGDPVSLKSYYYAISDLSVAGRRKCHGHAGESYQEPGEPERYSCKCEHNTAGANCERCEDLYNDRPWRQAEDGDAHECKECQCNGHTDHCHFDKDVYEASGNQSGGVCDNCKDNTQGRKCELCLPSFNKNAQGVCT